MKVRLEGGRTEEVIAFGEGEIGHDVRREAAESHGQLYGVASTSMRTKLFAKFVDLFVYHRL